LRDLEIPVTNPSIVERKERFARKMAGKARPTVRSHNRLPPGQHLTTGFPVLDLGIQPEIPLSEWRLDVGGLVENPRSFTWEEFNSLPQFEDVSDFHCVTTWSKFDVRWSGVAFFTLAEIVRPKPEAKYVLFASYDDYTTNVRLEDVMDDDVLVASSYDGQPLPREHGRPVRIVVPKLYAWKSAKFVRSIEFKAEDKPGFWEVRGYSNTADPWTEDRFGAEKPASFAAAPVD
jgi:DMSO/TMAO reductase YedYZ molybdopterin-dependent catalytic subunit